MHSRRTFLARSAAGLFGTAGVCLALPGDAGRDGDDAPRDRIPDGSASRGMVTAATDAAIGKGLAYLAAVHPAPEGAYGTGQYRGNVAISSLVGMAMMAAGYQPNRGAYGRVVLDALRYVLSQAGVGGFLHRDPSGHGPMYSHGFGTLFLSEVSGMVHEPALRDELRSRLRAAVRLILDSQANNPQGAWRYTPNTHEADLSVTICQIMALRSARNAGIVVPKSAVDRCTEYVKACQDRLEGWFRYQKQGGGGGGTPGFARTAAGVCALNAAGIYHGPEVKNGLDFLLRNRPAGGFGWPDIHYFYGHYYAVQAMWTAGGTYWQQWYPAVREELLARQNPEGSWRDQICPQYATAMACIILQVPNNYLPILQK